MGFAWQRWDLGWQATMLGAILRDRLSRAMVWTVVLVAPVPRLLSVVGASGSSHWRHINSTHSRGWEWSLVRTVVWRGLRCVCRGISLCPFLDSQTCEPLAWGDRHGLKRAYALFPEEWAVSVLLTLKDGLSGSLPFLSGALECTC